MIERIGGVILLVAAAIACFGFVDRADSQMLWLNGQNFVAVVVPCQLLHMGRSLIFGRRRETCYVRMMRDYPLLPIAFCIVGQCVGVVLVYFSRNETLLFALGASLVIAYTALVLFIIKKLWQQTWVPFCDWVIDITRNS